jgi:hypothetical protein
LQFELTAAITEGETYDFSDSPLIEGIGILIERRRAL